MTNKYLPYDPGVLPSFPAPKVGEKLYIRVDGYPPFKSVHSSIRNPRHKHYSRFVTLRQAATKAMAGRAPYRKALRVDFEMHAPEEESIRRLNLYFGGILDTLDGSHGMQFTYLPIVFEDDCQVCSGESTLHNGKKIFYELHIDFL